MARLQRKGALLIGIMAVAAATAACAVYQPPVFSYLSESMSLTPVDTSPATPDPVPSAPALTDVVYVAPPVASPTPSVVEMPASTPFPSGPFVVATPVPSPSPTAPEPVSTQKVEQDTLPEGALQIPVQGVRPEQLMDTYTQSRSEGRSHDAMDISAPGGTPVVAAAYGRVLKLFQSERGGKTLYIRGVDNRTIYYYAHLAGYAPGIGEGKLVQRGQLIGFVGDTGNAGKGNFHLHFGISRTKNPRKFYGGEAVNPFPLLRPAQ